MHVESGSEASEVFLGAPTFHVIVWIRSTWTEPGAEPGYAADGYRITEVADVREVERWAAERGDLWAIYVEIPHDGGRSFARIAGVDPTQGEAIEVTATRL